MKHAIAVRDARVAAVSDAEYFGAASRIVRSARIRCLLGVFILDPSPGDDAEGRVHRLLEHLRDATWRGVDVRVLIGGSRTNLAIAEASQFGRDACQDLGIDARWLTGRDVRGSHAKMLVADRSVLLGSHNWSSGALTVQTQDSVEIESSALAGHLARTFELRWKDAAP